MTARSRRTTLIAALAMILAGSLAAPTAASASDPDLPYFTDTTGAAIAVKGDYRPIVGHFTDQLFDDILWYAPGPVQESQWTPCPGCEKGRFSKRTLPRTLQVNGSYDAVVGDFAGDGLDDIFWLNWDGPHDYLWTNNGSGGFTSRQLDMGAGAWIPIVLPDSQSGPGKDDILWQPDGVRSAPLWVFPDDGSGNAHTVARLTLPQGTPLVGDFDGNGAADIFFYGISYCRCEVPGPAGLVDTYWRRASSTAPGFTSTTQNITGSYAPRVGHLSGGGDARADIVWVGNGGPFSSGIDGPDWLWEGRPDGTFKVSGVTIHAVDFPQVLEHDGADTVWFPYDDLVWFDTTSGPVSRPTGPGPQGTGNELIGRFTTPDREDVFEYHPGSEAEHLYHPWF